MNGIWFIQTEPRVEVSPSFAKALAAFQRAKTTAQMEAAWEVAMLVREAFDEGVAFAEKRRGQ